MSWVIWFSNLLILLNNHLRHFHKLFIISSFYFLSFFVFMKLFTYKTDWFFDFLKSELTVNLACLSFLPYPSVLSFVFLIFCVQSNTWTSLMNISFLQVPQPISASSKSTKETPKMCQICFKITIKAPKWRYWCFSGISIANFEKISDFSDISNADFEQVNTSWDVPRCCSIEPLRLFSLVFFSLSPVLDWSLTSFLGRWIITFAILMFSIM